MRELDKVLNTNEKVLWEGKPKFWPFVLNGVVPTFFFGAVWTGLSSFMFFLARSDDKAGFEAFGFLGLFILIGLLMVFVPLFYFPLVYKRTYYAITDKRVLIQKGIIGRDFNSIDFDQVTNADVNVSTFDVLCRQNTGTIMISTSGGGSMRASRNGAPVPYRLLSVTAPYDVIKFFKKVSFDVKTDMYYPNAIRPGQNPGYKTDYDPNKK